MTYTPRNPLSDDVHTVLDDYPELVRTLLYHRGITTKVDAEDFLNPHYEEHTHDPMLLKDIEKAVERILKAIEKNEKIVIFSDYDTDGIPGGVVLHDFFKKIGYDNFTNYIPHRNNEGFGLNIKAVEKLSEEGAKLIITVDCGISDVKEVARANELGVDVIITDHHLPHDKVPAAYAIVNPNQEGCEYPFKELCGAAVAFKLVQALLKEMKNAKVKMQKNIPEGWEKWLLDMVGIATLSDMVPLTGENRVFAHYGLTVLRKSGRPGLQRLLKKVRIDQTGLTEDDVTFMISPRINAASRMDVPEKALQMLAAADDVSADALVSELDALNTERKSTIATIVKNINKRIGERGSIGNVIVIGDPEWKPGLVGLAAHRIVDNHKRTAFVWGRSGDGVIKGSCRSDKSVDLMELMSAVGAQFKDFGGHAASGGFSIEHDNIHTLEQELNKAYGDVANGNEAEPVWIDAELTLGDVNTNTYMTMRTLAPFGMGNTKPLLAFKGLTVLNTRLFGKAAKHIDLFLKDTRGKTAGGIQFFVDEDGSLAKLTKGDTVDLVAHIEKETFRGQTKIRLRIVDVLS